MILHIDMDAFYASVEIRDRTELRDMPVIVGGSPEGRGVVAAANYVARKFGVHSAMPSARARRLCPQAVFLRPQMSKYADVSQQIREIFFRFTPLVEPLSLDEAFLDVTGSRRLFGEADQIGHDIKAAISSELQLVASVGVAPNKFLAKIASDLEKPNGFCVVDPERIEAFLAPLPIGRLWGVGKEAARILSSLGVERIGQLCELPVETLVTHFGRGGEQLWRLSHGIDNRKVVPDHTSKSISHETTFPIDVDEMHLLRAWLMDLTEEVARRLRRHQLRGRTVTLKLRYSDFQTITRAITLREPTNTTSEIWETALQLLRERLPNRPLCVRLLGVAVSGMERNGVVQQQLFEVPKHQKQSRLDEATDAIRERFGSHSVSRASRLETGEQVLRDGDIREDRIL